jgi:hypothetical protein
VVDLPRAGYRSRFETKVATALRRARRIVGADRAEFAASLAQRLYGGLDGKVLDPRQLAAWEEGDEDVPAVVLMAAAELATVEVDLLLGRLPVLTRIERLERQLKFQGQQLRVLSERLG